MEAEYDQMADEYDATRDVPSAGEIDAIRVALEGCRTVLDVGIGTGRFGKPIADLGFEVTGVDVSRRMLLKARAKGLSDIIAGDAYSLPLKGKAFDAAIIIHVLHVVTDWPRVMREIGRTTKGNVLSILRVPRDGEGTPQTDVNQTGKTQAGGAYQVRTQHRMWQNERELLARVPPTRLERVRDETIEIPIADAFRRLEAKRSVAAQMIPAEMKRMMMERIIAMSGSQVVHRRIVEDLAVWRADQLESLS